MSPGQRQGHGGDLRGFAIAAPGTLGTSLDASLLPRLSAQGSTHELRGG